MELSIRLILIATVGLIAVAITLFMFNSQSDGFSGFLDSQEGNAQCQMGKTQFSNACDCGSTPPDTDRTDELETKYESDPYNCKWAESIHFTCGTVCKHGGWGP